MLPHRDVGVTEGDAGNGAGGQLDVPVAPAAVTFFDALSRGQIRAEGAGGDQLGS